MIIKTRDGGNLKLQSSAEWGFESWIPVPGMSRFSEAGVPVTDSSAMGLPAVSSVIRSPAEVIATLPFLTYRDPVQRERAQDTIQWELLHEKPSDYCNTFEFFYDLVLSLEATQNAFINKAKLPTGELVALTVVDPQRVTVRYDEDGDKVFDVYVSPTDIRRGLTPDEILHVRGFTPRPGGLAGVSLMEVHRDPIGSAIAMQQFEGDFFRNHAVPPMFFTGSKNRQQAEDIADSHNMAHRGIGRQWKVGSLWGEVSVQALPISMRDAMFIEAKNMAIEDICRIWRWPRRFLDIGEVREAALDFEASDANLLKLYVLPRLRRIERAFAADPDLYFGSDLFGEFLTAALERGDTKSRYDAYRMARQGGWVTANELREFENLPPLPDGDTLLQTPVGAAPNATSEPSSDQNSQSKPSQNGVANVNVENLSLLSKEENE